MEPTSADDPSNANRSAAIRTDPTIAIVTSLPTQHLYAVNPIKTFEERAQGLFSTHLPIVDRIKRLRVLRGAAPVNDAERRQLMSLD